MDSYTYCGVDITPLLVEYSKRLYDSGGKRAAREKIFRGFAVALRAKVFPRAITKTPWDKNRLRTTRSTQEELIDMRHIMSGMSYGKSWLKEEEE